MIAPRLPALLLLVPLAGCSQPQLQLSISIQFVWFLSVDSPSQSLI